MESLEDLIKGYQKSSYLYTNELRKKQLKVIRFFLPRISSMDLGTVIDNMINKCRDLLTKKIDALQKDKDDKTQALIQKFKRRIDIVESKISSCKIRRFVMVLLLIISIIVGVNYNSLFIATVILIISLIVTLTSLGNLRNNLDKILSEKESELRKIDAEFQSRKSDEQAKTDKRIMELNKLNDKLLKSYHLSIASEEEVKEFIDDRMSELSKQVVEALGLVEADVLDEKCAEVHAPTCFQIDCLPAPVLEDIESSQRDIIEMADDIIDPLKDILQTEGLWDEFRNFILPRWGLKHSSCPDEMLSALNAIRYSDKYRTFLSGHYFFQKIVCTEDFVGQFRGYINVLNLRIAYTNAMQLIYSDISAIGTETAINSHKYNFSQLEISQNTHTLTLYLNCGASYRMSGDGGSKGVSLSASGKEISSKANDNFKKQISNIRALTLEKKRNLPLNNK